MTVEKGGSAVTDMLQSRAGLAAIVMAVAGLLLVNQVSLDSERPNANATGNLSYSAPQDVDARLWQDPFQTVSEAIKNKEADHFEIKVNKGDLLNLELTKSKDQNQHSRDDIYKEVYKDIEEINRKAIAQSGVLDTDKAAAAKEDSKIMVMAVMMSASATPEQHEARLRRRYALISAMARKGYAPVDAEHIGYFNTLAQEGEVVNNTEQNCEPKPNSNTNGAVTTQPAKNPTDKKQNATAGCALPKSVPFEWFEIERKNIKYDEDETKNKKEIQANKGRSGRVLVLWVDDTRFDRNPVKKILELFRQVAPSKAKLNQTEPDYVVMGPSLSSNLRAMAKEVELWDDQSVYKKEISDAKLEALPDNIRFYSAQATAADSEILEDIKHDEPDLTQYFGKRNIHLDRTIADDKKVIKTLVDELATRHIKVNEEKGSDGKREGDHVVLLSDWDTLYGRALPRTFEMAYEHEDIAKCKSYSKNEYVHCFKYVRGIDGALPGAADKNDAKAPPSHATPDAGNVAATDERPTGLSQKDYLRRIVDEIRKLDDQILKEKPCFDQERRCGVAAIGVLGFDVYDKLMILRALRPYFPNKIFFTTDLSASYWSTSEMPYTHNLLVASGFGLTLNAKQQNDIPPFRDSYQTSFFLSCLVALGNDNHVKDSWVDTPRIFEIGRNGPVDLSEPSSGKCSHRLSECDYIHPPGIFDNSEKNKQTELKWILGEIALLLLYLTSWSVRKWINHIVLKDENSNAKPKDEATDVNQADAKIETNDGKPNAEPVPLGNKNQWARIGILLAFILPVLVLAIISDTPLNKEPWLWFEGVSIWPTELLRYIAFVASVALLHFASLKVAESDEDIGKKYGLEIVENTPPRRSLFSSRRIMNEAKYFRSTLSILEWKSGKWKNWEKDKKSPGEVTKNAPENKDINVKELWSQYRILGEEKRRFTRSLLGVLVFVALAWLSIILTGGLTVPARGEFAYVVDRVIIALVAISMLFLVMWVVDASRLCAAFIFRLSEAQSDWDTGIETSCEMSSQARQWGLPSNYVAYWLDIQFVAKRTETLQTLIWYPLIPISLLAIARIPIFDDWSHPAGLVVTLLLLVVYLLSCAFLLERGAKKMRVKATEKLGEELRELRGQDDSSSNPKIPRLEAMIKEIEGIKKGAFLPFFQQPWVEAVLALASGAGGLAWFGNSVGHF